MVPRTSAMVDRDGGRRRPRRPRGPTGRRSSATRRRRMRGSRGRRRRGRSLVRRRVAVARRGLARCRAALHGRVSGPGARRPPGAQGRGTAAATHGRPPGRRRGRPRCPRRPGGRDGSPGGSGQQRRVSACGRHSDAAARARLADVPAGASRSPRRATDPGADPTTDRGADATTDVRSGHRCRLRRHRRRPAGRLPLAARAAPARSRGARGARRRGVAALVGRQPGRRRSRPICSPPRRAARPARVLTARPPISRRPT